MKRIFGNLIALLAITTLTPRIALPQTAPLLKLPDGQALLMSVQAEGVQIYVSKAKAGSPTAYEWTLKAPRATLYDNERHEIGSHSAGPTWEMKDGSRVVGQQPPKQRVAAANPGDIPYLLLEAKSHEGAGILSSVTYILRVSTSGGVAPAEPPTGEGQEKQVKYRATYLFLVAAPPD